MKEYPLKISIGKMKEFIMIFLNKNLKEEVLSKDEENLILRVLNFAGFSDIDGVIKGKVSDFSRKHCELDKEYVVNNLCPLKVMHEKFDDKEATAWLEAIYRKIISVKAKDEKSIEELAVELRKYLPLRMYVNESGAIFQTRGCSININSPLREHPDKDTNIFGEKDDLREKEIGIHLSHGGKIYLVRESEKFYALYCPGCGLRELIPCSIKTYGELELYFIKKYSIKELKYL